MVKAIISSDIKICGLECADLEELRNLFTYINPLYYKLKNMPKKINAHYLEHMKYIYAYTMVDNDTISLPRGSIDFINKHFADKGYDLDMQDKRRVLEDVAFTFKETLRDYQVNAVDMLIKTDQGILESPPGSGKTVMALNLISRLKQPTLIIVGSTLLLEQWKERIKQFLDVDPGQFSGSKKKIGSITVATLQTLQRLDDDALNEIGSKFGCVIGDEIHHIPCQTFYKVLNSLDAKYRYGLSATLKRKDKLEFLMYLALGNYQTQVPESVLQNNRVDLKVKFIYNYAPILAMDWTNIIEQLTNDKARNDLIIKNVMENYNKTATLILTNRVEHCKLLADSLQCDYLVGESNKQEREIVLAKHKKNKTLLVATYNLLGEGIDFPYVNTIHLVFPSNNFSLLKQITGRIKRKQHVDVDKKGMIYDYFDIENPVLYKCCQQRKKFYEQMGIEQISPLL